MTEPRLIARIADRLRITGLSPGRASLQAGLDRSFLRKFIQDHRAGSPRQLRPATLRALAAVLGCNRHWLLTGQGRADDPEIEGDTDAGPDRILAGVFVPGPMADPTAGPARTETLAPVPVIPAQGPQDVPVLATVLCTAPQTGPDQMPGGSPSPLPDGVAGFRLSLPTAGAPPPTDYVRRPPGLMRARDAYVIYVPGDDMAPRYRAGEMICVSPSRPPRPGDDVVVILTQGATTGAAADVQPHHACLAELVCRAPTSPESADPGTIILRQHGNNTEFPLALTEIHSVHRLYTMAELMGH